MYDERVAGIIVIMLVKGEEQGAGVRCEGVKEMMGGWVDAGCMNKMFLYVTR